MKNCRFSWKTGHKMSMFEILWKNLDIANIYFFLNTNKMQMFEL